MPVNGPEDRIVNDPWPWVLIRPLDTQVPQPNTWERDFQLFRICACSSSCFISAKSIVRGVVVIPTYTKEGDYYVFDLLDDDIFSRVRDLWKERLGQD